MPHNDSNKTRRQFLASTASASAVAASMPYFFSPMSAYAKPFTSANDRIPMGLIGAGGMGLGNMRACSAWADTVAIADVDKSHLNHANQVLAKGKADLYEDYREIIARDDIKLLHIATPDHWHTKPLIEAMRAGKDVYCEKPLTLTIDEGKLIRKVQQETGRIVQVGTQQRSSFDLFTRAIAIVAEGRLGKLKRVQVAIGPAFASPAIPVVDVPKELNWDKWLGPAPLADYRLLARESDAEDTRPDKVIRPWTNGHYEFRWWYEYSGGKLTDWGAHHVDICMWALAVNGQATQPVSIDGTAEHPVTFQNGIPQQTDRYNTALKFNFNVAFPGDVELVIRDDTDNGVLLEGDQGRIFVNRGKLVGQPVDDLADNPLPEDALSKVYKNLPMEHNERRAHWANFFHCVDQRLEPISDVHSHMEMLNICHLAGICARLGRKLDWDGETQQIKVDEQANAMLKREYRAGYEIEDAVAEPAAASS